MDGVPVPSRGPKADPDAGNELLETPLMVCAANGSAARGAPTVDAYAVDSYPSSPFSASCDS